jgi:hypothetical protein
MCDYIYAACCSYENGIDAWEKVEVCEIYWVNMYESLYTDKQHAKNL